MKMLITGGTGRVGSRVVPYLLQKGHQVRLLVRDTSKAHILENLGAETVQGDVTTATSVFPAVKDIEVVIHLAAYFRVRNDDEGIKAVSQYVRDDCSG